MASQRPDPDAVVTAGDARFQVLTPTLVRAEYASDGDFEDRPTFFAADREFPTPTFDATVSDGWLEIDTGAARVRYEQDSGPFTASNLEIEVTVDGETRAGTPEWNGTVLSAGDATLADGAELTDGGVALGGGAATWTAHVPADDTYHLAVQASDATTLDVTVDGEDAGELRLNETGAGRLDVELDAGTHEVTVAGTATIESAAVSGIGVTEPSDDNIGGWYRDLDGDHEPVDMWDGLLSRNGYFLLDDSDTAVETGDWVEARDRDDVYQDGYLFAYGDDYKRALREFRELTGPAPLLPKWTFGTWFSRYYPYSVEEYQEDLLPAFREHEIPLDVLVVDTDWKAPKIPGVKGAGASWSGWNWDRDLFPDPNAFFDWTDEEGLHTVMNVHPSIYVRDPKAPLADHIAGGLDEGFFVGPDYADAYVWDWADPDDVDSYFSLHEEFDREGNELWWLDWLADGSEVSTDGLTPDAWINHQYAERRREVHGRGFAFSRIGAEFTNDGVNSTGPWADHRDALHFTGDTAPTWEMLDFQTYFTVREGAIGVPYVSHDIGSHTGGRLDPELYARWIQAGTFQPVLRLHSVPGGLRLPWQYEGEAREVGAKFLRLRHALVPYLYTVAREAHDTGLPMCRGLYLDHPDRPAAYEYDREFLLGDDVLVAPVGHESDAREDEETTFTVGMRCEAEEAELDDCYANAFYSGFSGPSYADGMDNEDATITWDLEDVPEAGEYDLTVRYANHAAGGEEPSEATLSLSVDGERRGEITVEPTDSWHDWATVRTNVSLPAGDVDLSLAHEEGAPNVDFAAVVEPGDEVPEMPSPDPVPPAERDVWFPPGEWVDFFTGETYEGPAEETVEVPIERAPVFVRAGGVVPLQPYMDHVDQRPVDPLVLKAYPGDDGRFDLYEDEGTGAGYEDGDYAVTPITQREAVEAAGHDAPATAITVGATDGDYPGMPAARGYEVEFVGVEEPATVTVDGETVGEVDPDGDREGWWHDGDDLHVRVGTRDREESVTVARS